MAEALMTKRLAESSGYTVQSAGVAASCGSPASIETRNILLDHDLDFSSFRSQPVTIELLEESDYVFCMSRMHRQAIVNECPEFREKVLLVGEFLGADDAQDVYDPFGMGEPAYKAVEEQLLVAIEGIADFIKTSDEVGKEIAES